MRAYAIGLAAMGSDGEALSGDFRCLELSCCGVGVQLVADTPYRARFRSPIRTLFVLRGLRTDADVDGRLFKVGQNFDEERRVEQHARLCRAFLPLLARLLHAHPELSLDVRLQDSYADLVRDGLDMALRVGQVLMLHAGVLPQWTADQTLALAGEVEAVLRSNEWEQFMPQMYGGLPNVWHDDLAGADRLRVIVNALTRLRFCDAHGAMDFSVKEGASQAPAHLMPWFDAPGRLTTDVRIAFGHWSTLQAMNRNDVVCLDDG